MPPQDIDGLRRIIETLGESEKRYHVLFEQCPYGVLLVDDKGQIVEFNEAAHQQLGYSRAEFERLTLADIDPVEDIEEIRARIARILRDGKADFFVKHKTKMGEVRDVHVITQMIVLSGRVYSHALWIDVTDERRMERTQHESEEKFRTLFESAADGIMIISLEGRVLDMNSVIYERLGYTRDELFGMHLTEIDSPEFAPGVPERLAAIREQGKAIFEIAHKRKDGTLLPVEVNARVTEIAGEKVLLSIVRDISERKRMERTQRESEEKFRTLFEGASDGIMIASLEGRIIDMNTVAHERLGYTRQEMLGMRINQIDSSEFTSGIPARVAAILEHGKGIFEVAHLRKDGTVMPVEANVRLVDLGGEKVLLSIARDITERKRMERTQRESEEKFRTLFESASDGIIIMSLDGRFLDMNTAAHERLGYTKQEMLGFHITDIDSPESAALVPERIAKIHAEGKATFEVGHVRKDGAVIPMEASVRLVELGGERVLLSIARDITERKRAEHAIRRSESSLAASQRIAHVGSWEWDIETNKVQWSDELYRINGLQPGEIAPDYALVLSKMHPDTREAFLSAIDAALKGERPFDLEYSFFRQDGSVAFLHTMGEVFRDESGRPRRMVGMVQDITERKKTEDILRDSEEKFRAIFEYANDGILIADVSSRRFVAANRRICEMLGYSEDELLGLDIEEIHPKDALPRVIEEFKRQVAGEKIVAPDLPVLRKDGTVFYADISTAAFMFGGRRYSVGAFRDITERKKAEAILRDSEEKFRTIFESVNDGILIADPSDRRFVAANRAICEMLGYTADELTGLGVEDIHPRDALPHVMEEFEKQASGEIIIASDLPVQRKDGTVFFADVGTARITLGGRQCLLGVFRDITERKRMEEEIRETNRLLHSLMQAIPDMVYYRDAEGRYVMANRMTAVSMGLPMEDLIGKTNYDFMPREMAEMCIQSDEAAIKSIRPEHSEEHFKGPDGQMIYLDTIKTCIYDDEGRHTGLLGISRDITERVLMEEQLRKSLIERETLLRELYHRTKNNMNVIRSLINLQTSSLVADEKIHQMFRDLQNRIMSMSLVHERLYRSQDLSHVRLRDYVGDLTDAMLRAYKVRPGSVAVKLDIADFELSIDTLLPCGLVINELMANSFKYAFPDGRSGEITISGHISHDGEIRLAYADNGVGFPEGFDMTSTGTLGLKLIKGLMTSQLRGKVEITARPGAAFTFTFREPEYEKRL